MASNPISSWQIGGKKVETVADFIFLVSKITVDSDCSHKIERHLHLERKAMTNLQGLRLRGVLPSPTLSSWLTQDEKWKKVKVKSLSRVQLFVTPWTVAYQAPLSMGFSRYRMKTSTQNETQLFSPPWILLAPSQLWLHSGLTRGTLQHRLLGATPEFLTQ